MLAITYTEEDLRLLEAADIAERNADYHQEVYKNGYGSPACLLGGYAAAHPETWDFSSESPYLKGIEVQSPTFSAMREFGLSYYDAEMLFSSGGCDNACTDGKKAAAYVRRFVEERAKERIRA
jgi:hypothetical protein